MMTWFRIFTISSNNKWILQNKLSTKKSCVQWIFCKWSLPMCKWSSELSKWSLTISLGQPSLCEGTDYYNVTIIAKAKWTPKTLLSLKNASENIFSRPPSAALFTHLKLKKTSPKIGPSRCARFVFVILYNTLSLSLSLSLSKKYSPKVGLD